MSHIHYATTDWDEAAYAELRKLVERKFTVRQIAIKFRVARTTIRGHMKKLGLTSLAPSDINATRRNRRKFGAPRPPVEQLLKTYQVKPVDPAKLLAPSDNLIPFAQRCTLLTLTESTCRWPVGDPGDASFFFCGGKTISGLSYCDFHCRIAYIRPERRNG